MLTELPNRLAGTLIACMGRGLAIETLQDIGNPKALHILQAMEYADTARLLQHASEDDSVALAAVSDWLTAIPLMANSAASEPFRSKQCICIQRG